MHRTYLIIIATLLAGIVAGMAVGQQRVKYVEPEGRSERDLWPPRPENILNLVGETRVLAEGEHVPFFQVPASRWLVLTDFRVFGNGLFGAKLVTIDNGTTTDLLPLGLTWLQTGYALKPGTVLGIRNTSNPGCGGCSGPGLYSVHGYFVDV